MTSTQTFIQREKGIPALARLTKQNVLVRNICDAFMKRKGSERMDLQIAVASATVHRLGHDSQIKTRCIYSVRVCGTK